MKRFIILFVAVLLLATAGGAVYFFLVKDGRSEDTEIPTGSTTGGPGNYEAFEPIGGDWRGTWTNTTFGSTGDILLSMSLTPEGTATMTMDIGGQVFGILDPQPMSLTGFYNANSLNLAGEDDFFGRIAASVDLTNNFTFLAPAVSAPGLASLSLNGSFNKDSNLLTGAYIINKEDGSIAEGVITLTK